MPDPTPPVLARTLDRAALERVLQRAAELQAHASDVPEVMTEEQLVQLGKEVGLTPESIRQAIAEERTRVTLPDGEGGWAGRTFGPAAVSVARTVPGTPEKVLATVDDWMRREECLQVKRWFPDRVTWEARRDLFGNMKRGLNLGGRGYYLTRAGEVAATVIAVDDARSLVRLDADLARPRSARLASGGVTAGVGALAAGSLAVIGTVLGAALLPVIVVAAAPAVIGAGIGYQVARGHRGTAARVQLALEQVLDRLEHGEAAVRTPSVWKMLGPTLGGR